MPKPYPSGAFTSLVSVLICVTGATVGGTNVHGPLFFFCLLIFPVPLVGLLVWLSAAFSKAEPDCGFGQGGGPHFPLTFVAERPC